MDRDNVIRGLECCLSTDLNDCTPTRCPYFGFCGGHGAPDEILRDALALLKSQEPVEPKIVDTSNSMLYHNDMFKNHYCGNCGEFLHVVNRKDLFCSQCGRAVKWE